MIALENIGVNGVAYLLLALILAFVGWTGRERTLVLALALTGSIMAASWMRPLDLIALAVFLSPAYFVARVNWGRGVSVGFEAVAIVVSTQVLLFLILKRYAWFDILGWWGHPVAIIGISYILFRQIHLVVDAPYLGKCPFSPVHYIAFVLSPWTLVAGPIQRYDDFNDGVTAVERPSGPDLLAAMHRGINGLIKAFVLSPLFFEPSRIANLANPDAGWLELVLVVYGFPIYLYLNFSGYTDLMIAAARFAGFKTLPENFNHPYVARNSRDFWTRWHMSFGTWVRYYVFTPVSTALFKVLPATLHTWAMISTVVVVFLVVGGWHGTTSNYFVFGLTQAAGVLVSGAFEGWRRRKLGVARARAFAEKPWFRGISIFVTFNFTCLCMVLLNGSLSEVSTNMASFFVRHGF